MKLTLLLAAAMCAASRGAWHLSSFFTVEADFRADQVNARLISRLLILLKEVDELRAEDQRSDRMATVIRVEATLASLEAKVSGSSEQAQKSKALIKYVRSALKEEMNLLSDSSPDRTLLSDTDFPTIVVLIGCGVVGWVLTKGLRWTFVSRARLNLPRKVDKLVVFDDRFEESPMTHSANRKVAARSKRKELTRPKKISARTAPSTQESSLSMSMTLDFLHQGVENAENLIETSLEQGLRVETYLPGDDSTTSSDSSFRSSETEDSDEGCLYGHVPGEAPVLFRPLPSSGGEQFYTDGHSIFRIACVPLVTTAELHENEFCDFCESAVLDVEDSLLTRV